MVKSVCAAIAVALSVGAAGAHAQEFARQLQNGGPAATYYSPIFSFDEVERGATRGKLQSMLAGALMPPDLRYKTTFHCYAAGDNSAQRCARYGRMLSVQLGALSNFSKAVARLTQGMQAVMSSDGLPSDSGRPDADREGFRFVVHRTAPPSPKRPVDAARASIVDPGPQWTETNSAPLEPARRIRLHPVFEPYRYNLAPENRRPADGLAFNMWLSSNALERGPEPSTVFSVADEDGSVFALHLLPNGEGFGVSDGSGREIYVLPVNVEHRRPYRASLRSRADSTELYIDGALAASVGVGYQGGTSPAAVTLGASNAGDARFDGYVGAFTMWTSYLEHAFDRAVRRAKDPSRPYGARANLLITTAKEVDVFALQTSPPRVTPKTGWWRQVDLNETRIHNLEDVIFGAAHPNFSPLHQALDAKRRGRPVYAPAERHAMAQLKNAGASAERHALFSIHPLYRIEVDDGLDPASFELRDSADQPIKPSSRPFPSGEISALYMESADQYLSVVGLIACDTKPPNSPRDHWIPYRPLTHGHKLRQPSQTQARAQCELDPQDRRSDWIWFDADEEIRGLAYKFLDDGRIANLTVYTNKRELGPYASGAERQGKLSPFVEPRRLWLAPGQAFYGLQSAGDDKGFQALAFLPGPGDLDAGLTLFGENGDAIRFSRETPGLLKGSAAKQGLAPHGEPLILTRSETLIEVVGIDPTPHSLYSSKPVAFEFIEPNAAPAPSDNYNNTFVSLSKAVNLQANYVGYDIIQMDPIHLTRTGATGSIFRQPLGETRDYYDFNRTFIPRGLVYVPEYTGDLHKSVEDTTTYAEFKSAASQSVNAGLTSKLIPSFSLSSTMKQARETISERRMSKTFGTSRAYFYDLVLDKSEAHLDPEFRRRVARLAVAGDYHSFIETYGTHYAAAVVYGGMAVLEIDADSTTRAQLQQKGIETKAEAKLLLDMKTQTGVTFGSSDGNESSQEFKNIVSSEQQNFYWVGGAHVGLGSESWSVGTDGVVPVHVTLRPISELLAPSFFPDPDQHVRVRHALERATDDYIASHNDLVNNLPPPDQKGYFEVRMDRLICGETPPPGRQNFAKLREDRKDFDYPRRDLEPVAASVYPVIQIQPYDARRNMLHNFGQAPAPESGKDAPKPATPSAIHVLCNTTDDILAKSPELQANALTRVELSANHIANDAVVEFIDFRKREFKVLHKRISDDLDTEGALKEGALIGVTFGLKILWDEYVSKQGSKTLALIDKIKNPVPKSEIPGNLSRFITAKELLCGYNTFFDEEACMRQTTADIRRKAGEWVAGVIYLFKPTNGCEHCVDYQLHYSARYYE